ncbi:MAG: thrombospondin type 3 repeat-containing protein [Maribacter sp.]
MFRKYSTLLVAVFLLFCFNGFSQTNLISNGDFENWTGNQLDDWTTITGPLTQIQNDFSSGANSLELYNNVSGNEIQFETSNIVVEPGKTYVLKFDSKVIDNPALLNNNAFAFNSNINNFSPVRITITRQNTGSSTITTWRPATSANLWMTHQVIFEAEGTGNYVFKISRENTSYPIEQTLVDNFRLFEISELPENNADRASLIALYDSTNGSNWQDSWDLSKNMLYWEGVVLNELGKVIHLNLSSRNIIGTLPEELGNLNELKSLNLNKTFTQSPTNIVTGSIPNSFNNLDNLELLKLYGVGLSGNIPSIGLNKLKVLNLSSNGFTGSIPSSIGNHTDLKFLNLSSNELSGPLPLALFELSNLSALGLSGYSVNSPLPNQIGQLQNLQALNLSNCDLTGEIPAQLGNLPKLIQLLLSDNQFEGSIPISLGQLPELINFQVAKNNLSNSIPVFLNDMPLFIVSNNDFVFEDLKEAFNNQSNPNYNGQSNISQTETVNLNEGETFTISVSETTDEDNLYQWRKNGSEIAGETDPTLTIEDIKSTDAGIYDCVISNTALTLLKLQKEPITLNYLGITDSDNDGVQDSQDNCANTPTGETVDTNGCSQSQLDDDNDGVSNSNDNCPNTPTGNTVDTQGCIVNNSGLINYLQNFSFEDWSGNPETPDSWTIANENSLLKSTDATDGGSSLELDLNNSLQFQTEIYNGTPIQLATNTTYTYAFDYKVKRGVNVSARIQITDDGNPFSPRIADEFVPFNDDGNWHTFSFDFDTNSTDEDHVFKLLFRANTTITGIVVVDNVRVLGNPLPDGDNDGVLDGNDQCPNTPSTALAVDDVGCEVAIDNSNLVTDPSFEDWSLNGGTNLRNWGRNLIPGSSWNKNEDISDNLEFSLELTTGDNGSNAASIFKNNIQFYQGLEYLITIDYRVLEGTFETLEIELAEDIFADPELILTPNPIEGGWQTFTTTFTPSKNGIFDLRIAVISAQAQGRILLDNMVIRPNISGTDDDNDGVNNTTDNCPNTPAGEVVDANGCSQSQLDDDNDGVTNDKDNCPNTLANATVDANGCAQSQLDDDNDGVTNDKDNCPNTPANTTVDANGCPITTNNDADNDGVIDSNDQCANTPAGETVDANGCAQSQLDDDNDGVTNDKDNCPNTPANTTVDANGCATNQNNEPDIPNNGIQVKVTSTSCADASNGEITVNFDKDYNYSVQISSDGIDDTFNSVNNTNGLVVSDLSSGIYSVCVTIPDFPDFEQCSTVLVETPDDFTSGKIVVDQDTKTGKLTVSGSKNYELTINEKELNYSFDNTSNQEISFQLEDGMNNVFIKTDKVCQGKYEESILLNVIRAFPNPVEDNTNIIGIQNTDKAAIIISDMSGVIVKRNTQNITNSTISISVEELPVGVYLLRIISEEQDVQTKIVKK